MMLASLLLLTRECRYQATRWHVTLAAGFLFGLVFAAHYAMAPCLPVGLLALGVCHYLRGNPWKVLVSRFVLFSAGFAIPAAPIMARNFILTHTLKGEGTLPITLDLSSMIP